MVKVAIIGGSGYTGLELMRLVARHPGVELTAVTSREFEGKPVSAVFPALAGICSLNFSWPDPAKLAAAADLFFVALPHKTAMAVIPTLLEAGAKVVDLSADFRFRDQARVREIGTRSTRPRTCWPKRCTACRNSTGRPSRIPGWWETPAATPPA